MTDITYWLDQGETIIKKHAAVLDQGYGNQSDCILFLTNRQIVFQVSQSGVSRGLDLKLNGEKDARVEYIWIPLELVSQVYKDRLSISIQSQGSLFQETLDRKGLFGEKGKGRVFENGSSVFKFAMHIFVDKQEWVDMIYSEKSKLPEPEQAVDQSQLNYETEPHNWAPQQVIKEKIIVKEVVKIKCQYCGTLYDQTASKCPHCGGNRN